MKGYSRSQWEKWIKEQSASGISIAEYCRQKKISDKGFYNWRSRLRENNQSKGSFVEISHSQERNYKLILSSGIEVRVPENFKEESLKRLIEVLEC